MPLYVFRCPACGEEQELLRPLGETSAPSCPGCGGPTRQRLSRVAVKYDAWGFSSTDRLVPDTRGKDFKALRDKANEIADA